MRCPHAQRLLSSRRDGRLSARDANALDAHLNACSVCRSYEQATTEMLARLNPPDESAHRTRLASQAIAQWSMEPTSPRPTHRPSRATICALAIAGGVVAATTCGLILRNYLTAWGPVEQGQAAPLPQVVKVAPIDPNPLTAQSTGQRHPSTQTQGALGMHTPQRKSNLAVINAPRKISIMPPNHQPLNTNKQTTDDLAYINADIAATQSRWTRLNVDQTQALLTRLQRSVVGGDDFVKIALPPIAGADGRAVRAAIKAYRRQAAIVDARLQYRVTLAVKGTPLSDLCRQLSAETGIQLQAGRTVADDKITVFCTDRPLRDLMRHITRLIGFTWLRDGQEGNYRYELAQDLRSQLLEEELRNRDRNAGLLALDREMERYRKYLALTPQQARKQAANAPKKEAALLETLAQGWGPIHLYFSLTPDEQRALCAGQKLKYEELNRAGERPLPPELHTNTLSALTFVHIFEDGARVVCTEGKIGGAPAAEFPGAHAEVTLQLLDQKQLDRFRLVGESGVTTTITAGPNRGQYGGAASNQVTLAEGIGPEPADIDNASLAALATMQRKITVTTIPSCHPQPDFDHWSDKPLATTADALEALHRATGQDIVADYYTRLYSPGEVSCDGLPLIDTLNRLSTKMRLHWKQDDGWLAFRSMGYYYDRRREVPQRLLARWADSHRKNGMLTLSDLTEMAQLTDAQLDAHDMARGAWALYGLSEWVWMEDKTARAQWRLLADFAPDQLEAVAGPKGIPFDQLTPAQQQRCMSLLTEYLRQIRSDLPLLEDFPSVLLRVTFPKPEQLLDVPKGTSYTITPQIHGPRFHYEFFTTQGGAHPIRTEHISEIDAVRSMPREF